MIIGKTEINLCWKIFRNVIYLMPTIRIERYYDGDKCYEIIIYLLWLRRGMEIEFNNGYFPF